MVVLFLEIMAINMKLSPIYYHLHFGYVVRHVFWGLFTAKPVSVAILSRLGDFLPRLTGLLAC